MAKFTNRVIFFCVYSWKFYLSQKIFYTSVTCDFCDKFHVCFPGIFHRFVKILGQNQTPQIICSRLFWWDKALPNFRTLIDMVTLLARRSPKKTKLQTFWGMEAKKQPCLFVDKFLQWNHHECNYNFRPCGSAWFEDTLVQLHTFRSLSCIRLLWAGAY